MWNIGPIQIQAILHIHINIHNIYPKVGLIEENKGGRKEGKKVSNNEIHHICVGPRYKETH
jgi:hypothetical protein